MASPEKNFGERNGERTRNLGGLVAVAGLFPGLNSLIFPGLMLAAGGEIWRRTSKPNG